VLSRSLKAQKGVLGHVPPEMFEILDSWACTFKHFELQNRIIQMPKNTDVLVGFNSRAPVA